MKSEGNKVRLTFKVKTGYAIGQFVDSIGFNIYYFFFLFFLTDFVGIPPAIAGTVSLIAILWDAIFDPVAGYLSDNLKSKYGRRRPLMIAAVIPYSIALFLIFNTVSFSSQGAFIYYLAMAIIFWSCYKFYVIPYFALGVELTDDFNERTTLRAWASVGIYISVLLTSALPPYLLDVFQQQGISDANGWRLIATLFSLMLLLCAFICWNFTRGKEKFGQNEAQGQPQQSLLKSFIEILKLKPTKFLAGSVFLWAVVSTMGTGSLIYLMSYTLGYSAERQSLFFIINSVVCILWLPLIIWVSKYVDKKNIYAVSLSIGTIGLLSFAFIGFPSFAFLILFCVIFCLGNSAYWTLYYSMMYDLCEVDDYVNYRRREGAITALMSFSQKLGAAIATWMIGFMLSMSGYNGALETQTPAADKMILYLNTLFPGLFGIFAVLVILFYPITKQRFEHLMQALKARKEQKQHSNEAFKKLL